MKIVGTNSDRYQRWYSRQGMGRNNGAYWYAREIEDIILPGLEHLNIYINTVGAPFYHAREVPNRAVIVCHDNVKTIKTYMKFFGKDILWICSKQSVADKFIAVGEKAVYIPLSVDVQHVEKFKRKTKPKDIAYVGNAWSYKKKFLSSLPKEIDQLNGMNRDDLLREMSKYKNIIAEGRCLIEAKILGAKCTLPVYDTVKITERDIFDSREAKPLWEKNLTQHAQANQYCILEVMKNFRDLQAGRNRRLGEMFTATIDRANELLSNELRIVERI